MFPVNFVLCCLMAGWRFPAFGCLNWYRYHALGKKKIKNKNQIRERERERDKVSKRREKERERRIRSKNIKF